MTREVMDVEEVAEYLGLAKATIYKWVERRDIPYTKVGTLLRFPKWVIDEWLDKRVTHPKDALWDRFVRLQTRYHLEQFIEARGLDLETISDADLEDELRQAIADFRDARQPEPPAPEPT
jgi:excisionase family DNA binding protein